MSSPITYSAKSAKVYAESLRREHTTATMHAMREKLNEKSRYLFAARVVGYAVGFAVGFAVIYAVSYAAVYAVLLGAIV